jgi:hypothetical protein
MNSQIAASPEAMLELAGNIEKSIGKIAEYNTGLAAKLDALGSGFSDEGYVIIRSHVLSTKGKIAESLPDFQIFLGKIKEIAGLYKNSQKAVESPDGLNWAGRVLAVPAMAVALGAGAAISADALSKPGANNFTVTQQTWITHQDGSTTYDSPVETGRSLDSRQGKVEGFKGTCGVVSSGNVLNMAGIKATEEELVGYCSKNSLCASGEEADENGGTIPGQRQQILSHYGVSSELQEQTVENIAGAVSSGKGVIISVDVEELWQTTQTGHHAVTVTSVTKDKNGGILGFWVTDSGSGDPAKYYTKDEIRNALTGKRMNVTTNIIR